MFLGATRLVRCVRVDPHLSCVHDPLLGVKLIGSFKPIVGAELFPCDGSFGTIRVACAAG